MTIVSIVSSDMFIVTVIYPYRKCTNTRTICTLLSELNINGSLNHWDIILIGRTMWETCSEVKLFIGDKLRSGNNNIFVRSQEDEKGAWSFTTVQDLGRGRLDIWHLGQMADGSVHLAYWACQTFLHKMITIWLIMVASRKKWSGVGATRKKVIWCIRNARADFWSLSAPQLGCWLWLPACQCLLVTVSLAGMVQWVRGVNVFP